MKSREVRDKYDALDEPWWAFILFDNMSLMHSFL